MNILRFETNIPVEVALKFDRGHRVSGRHGAQVFYRLADGRLMYLEPKVARRLEQLDIKAGEPFLICKREVRNGGERAIAWEITSLARPGGSRETASGGGATEPQSIAPTSVAEGGPNGDPAAEPAQPPNAGAPVTALERQLQASIEAVKLAKAHGGNGQSPPSSSPASAPTPLEPPAVNGTATEPVHRTARTKPAFQFRRAAKYDCKLRLAVAGPAGSGKTFTLLKLATELGGPIALVDTEHGSAEKYADQFQFDVLPLDTFNPDAIPEIIHTAAANGYRVLCIDGLSHFWTGKDGELDQVDRISLRLKSGNSFAAWREVSPKHNRMVDAMIAAPLHILASMRVKTEWVVEKDGNGKSVPRKVGLQPVMRDGIEYEFDVCGEMDQENTLIITKSRCPKLTGGVFVKPGRELAEILKEWLAGPPPPPARSEVSAAPAPDRDNGNGNGTVAADGLRRVNGSPRLHGSLPPDLVAIWKRMCSPRGVIEEFAKLKEAMVEAGGAQSESEYGEILKRHGVESASQFKTSQPARLCAKELYQAIQNFRQSGQEAPGIGVAATAAGEGEPEAEGEVAVAGGERHGD